ncbi:tRNA guanosine(34) transglycosylase Tgt [Nanoarchaeota archaeon]
MYKLKAESNGGRSGILSTRHGKIETPFFMPVVTKMAAKFLTNDMLNELGTEAFISNSFVLYLNPGTDFLKKAGGIHKFMNVKNIIFTDSGGFQMINPSLTINVNDRGITFRNPWDKSKHLVTPGKSMMIQEGIGSDVAMAFDHMPLVEYNKEEVVEATNRTHKWAEICKKAHLDDKQLLFGISQGGMYPELRKKSAEFIAGLDFDGYAIGGLAIGEDRDTFNKMAKVSVDVYNKINKEKPRYIMGVGNPIDLLNCVGLGIDLFDSRFPTQNARHNLIFTSKGPIKINKSQYKEDFSPLDEDCKCKVCSKYSKAYLHYLNRVGEPNAKIYFSYHNVYFVQNMMKEIRKAIKENRFGEYSKEFLKGYKI